jgi:hypothetical protein
MDRRSVDLVHRTMDLFHAFFNRKIIQKIFKIPRTEILYLTP